MTVLRSCCFAGLVITLLLGCAAPAQQNREMLVDGAGADSRPVVLILPLNITVVMAAELDARSSLVQDALEAYMQEQPFELKTVAFESARRLWLQSIVQARKGENGQRAGFVEAARIFVLELTRHAEFDYVIAPSLYIRESPVVRGVADWDDVRRTLAVDAVGAENRRLSAATPFEGVAPGASLHAVVLDARGEKLQEGLGGLDLIAKVHIPRERNPDTGAPIIEFLPRDDFFGDAADLREGISIALAPFVSPTAVGD